MNYLVTNNGDTRIDWSRSQVVIEPGKSTIVNDNLIQPFLKIFEGIVTSKPVDLKEEKEFRKNVYLEGKRNELSHLEDLVENLKSDIESYEESIKKLKSEIKKLSPKKSKKKETAPKATEGDDDKTKGEASSQEDQNSKASEDEKKKKESK